MFFLVVPGGGPLETRLSFSWINCCKIIFGLHGLFVLKVLKVHCLETAVAKEFSSVITYSS